MNILKVIFEKLEKMLKIADFANFGPKYLSPQIFTRHAVCGSKLKIQSNLGINKKIGDF